MICNRYTVHPKLKISIVSDSTHGIICILHIKIGEIKEKSKIESFFVIDVII